MPQPRKPTAILEAEGAFIRHPERARESEPETSDTKPLGDAPAYLDAFQKEVWADLSAQMLPGVCFASPDERAKTNAALINSMQMTPNEARAIEDRDWVEGGDILVAAANSCIFDPTNQEWFIPGQKAPQSAGTDNNLPNPKPEDEPDAAGSGSDSDGDAPNASKVKARLSAIANSLAERCERKFEKSGSLEAKFVAEVMNVSLEDAQTVCSTTFTNKAEMRAALIALATGEMK